MRVIRTYATNPGPNAVRDLNIEQATSVYYRVDDNRKLIGAQITMSSGEAIDVDADSAKHVMLLISDDENARKFLGIEESKPSSSEPMPSLASEYRWLVPLVLLLFAVLIFTASRR